MTATGNEVGRTRRNGSDDAKPVEAGGSGISRRDFLRNAGVLSGSAVALAGGGRRTAELLLRPRSRPRASNVTDINIWSWYTEDEPVWPTIAKEFSADYPKLKVTPRTFGTLADYSPVIESAVSAGNAPEILAPATLAISYGEAGVVLNLKDSFPSSFLDGFFPSINAEYSLGSKQYAIGWEAQMFGLFYNPQLLAKAGVTYPETWQDLIDAVPKFEKIGVVPVSICGTPGNNTADFFLPLITQASNNPNLCLELDQLTKSGLSWDNSSVVSAFNLMKKLVDAKVFQSGADSTTATEAIALFYTGKAAMYYSGSFEVPTFKTSASKAFNNLYKIGQFPAWSSGAKHWASNQAGSGWSVNAKSPNAEAALTFLKWIYNSERYAKIMNETNSMAATQSAAPKGDNAIVREMASWITTNGCDHILFGVGSETAAGNVSTAVLGGKISPSAAAKELQSQVKQARAV